MKIEQLTVNNLKKISYVAQNEQTLAIGGLSGSGKSSFCSTISHESFRRIVTLLPKSEYRFLFGEILESIPSALSIQPLPLVFYLKRIGSSPNIRSTLATHSGLFKKIRLLFAQKYNLGSEFFSFNNAIMWCDKCKGRGSTAGVHCTICDGTRYDSNIKEYFLTLNGKSYNIIDLHGMTIQELSNFSLALNLEEVEKKKLEYLIELGLPYLSLNRIMSTLSGGETIRVLIAEFMAQCRGALMILDEISTGLDRKSLSKVLNTVRGLGSHNLIWFIDHSDTVLNSAKEKIFFGHSSGNDGGKIIEVSPRPEPIYPDIKPLDSKEYYEFLNLEKRNIKISKLEIPKHCITAITGESGCGKSTLVHECLIPYIAKKLKKISILAIGQDRNQSITSKSTISTFLGIKKFLKKYDSSIEEYNLSQILEQTKDNIDIYAMLQLLVELGFGYLTLNRTIQTLSTGEFQTIHLVSQLQNLKTQETIIIMDEPSKGLSQNILNLFMNKVRYIQQTYNVTILIIEHNEYILRCCDYIFDFGHRVESNITSLNLNTSKNWYNSLPKEQIDLQTITSQLPKDCTGITHKNENVDTYFLKSQEEFRGGLLKNFSQAAQWIYKDYVSDRIKPIVAIDFEEKIFSSNTFLFEIASTTNAILQKVEDSHLQKFDYYNNGNICKCCKGTGKIDSFKMSTVIANESLKFWDNLLHPEVMKALKAYNYTKIKFLFSAIQKETGLKLNTPYNKLSEQEKNVLLYGYWKNTFYDATKKTQRRWIGLIRLIVKYMRYSKGELYTQIKETTKKIICPICNGRFFNHNESVALAKTQFPDILFTNLQQATKYIGDIPQIVDFNKVLDQTFSLNMDISTLEQKKQVYLKCLDVQYAQLQGFTFVFRNLAPFLEEVQQILNKIAQNNRVILLDWDNITDTKQTIIEKLFCDRKLKENTYVYELFGFKKIITDIRTLRKKYPCPYCNGKMVLRDESIFEGVDVTETSCTSCQETGFSAEGLEQILHGHSVFTWLKSSVNEVISSTPPIISSLHLSKQISQLNKRQLIAIYKYLGDKND